MSEKTPSEAAAAALRDSVATWDEIVDELVCEKPGDPNDADQAIDASRVEWFCSRFPHFEKDIRGFVHAWNADPKITDEMLTAIEISPEEVSRTVAGAMRIIKFYQKLRSVEEERDALQAKLAEMDALRQRYAILNSKYGLCVAGCTQLKGALMKAETQRNFLLENFIEGEDGSFTFPDGETWACKKK